MATKRKDDKYHEKLKKLRESLSTMTDTTNAAEGTTEEKPITDTTNAAEGTTEEKPVKSNQGNFMGILVYCGLNKGNTFDKIISKNRFSAMFAFEANPELAEEATTKYRKNKAIKIIDAALAESNGTIEFYVYNLHTSSACGPISNNFIQHWKEKRGQELQVKKKITVPSVNLYDWCQSEGIKNIRYLLTDLQGLDFTVLKSIRPMFEKGMIRKVRCEVENNKVNPSTYPTLPSNKKHLFDEFFADIPYKQIDGPDNWNMKEGHHRDITWALQS